MTEWERIVAHFEEHGRPCQHGHRPIVTYEPGCLTVETGKCGCRIIDGEGLPLSKVLALWPPRPSGISSRSQSRG